MLYNFKFCIFSAEFIVTKIFSFFNDFSTLPYLILSTLKKNFGFPSKIPCGIETIVPVISEFTGAKFNNSSTSFRRKEVFIIPTDEEYVIAKETENLIQK